MPSGIVGLFLSLVPQDVVIVVMDDIGAYERETLQMPNLEALAACGVDFTRGYSQPWCAPTRASIMQSRWDGAASGSMCSQNATRWPDQQSIADLFKAQGYSTGIFGKWHLGPSPDPLVPALSAPQVFGYDTWQALSPDNVIGPCLGGFESYTRWYRVDDGQSSVSLEYHTQAVFDAWQAWWQGTTQGPRFAVFNFQAAHAPFLPLPPSSLTPGYVPPMVLSDRDGYEALIVSVDHVLGLILAELDLEEDLVVVIGDNGTPPDVTAPGQDPAKVKHSTFEQGVRVPYIIAGGGLCPRVVVDPVHVADLLPTFAEILGEPVTASIKGVSLTSLLVGWPPAREWTYVHTVRDTDEAVIERRWKLREKDGVQVVYDLQSDPLEESPLDPGMPDLAAVVARLQAHLASARL